MKLEEIRQLARDRGLKPAKLTKRELVKLIQNSEGNFDCFSSAVDGHCDQLACFWREDCFQEGTAPVAAEPAPAPAPAVKKSAAKKSVAKKKAAAKKKAVPVEKAPPAEKPAPKKKAAPKKKPAAKKKSKK